MLEKDFIQVLWECMVMAYPIIDSFLDGSSSCGDSHKLSTEFTTTSGGLWKHPFGPTGLPLPTAAS